MGRQSRCSQCKFEIIVTILVTIYTYSGFNPLNIIFGYICLKCHTYTLFSLCIVSMQVACINIIIVSLYSYGSLSVHLPLSLRLSASLSLCESLSLRGFTALLGVQSVYVFFFQPIHLSVERHDIGKYVTSLFIPKMGIGREQRVNEKTYAQSHNELRRFSTTTTGRTKRNSYNNINCNLYIFAVRNIFVCVHI